MAHSVIITSPMPTLDQIRLHLGLPEEDVQFVESLFAKKPSKGTKTLALKSSSSLAAASAIKRPSGIARKKISRARKTA